MKKTIFLLILVLNIFLICSCNRTQENNNHFSEKMKNYKTDFIGDSVNVINLIKCLPSIDNHVYQNMIAIQSYDKPYGVSIYYEPNEGYENLVMEKPKMLNEYAKNLFDNILNLQYVEFLYRKTPSNNILDKDKYELIDKIYKN